MPSMAERIMRLMDPNTTSRCTLAYTLHDSECARDIIETNLEQDNWRKIEGQLTLWTAKKPAVEFISNDSKNRPFFDKDKIRNKLSQYFEGTDRYCEVNADIALIIGNFEVCKIVFNKPYNSLKFTFNIEVIS